LAELTALAQIPWLDLRGPTCKGQGRRDGTEGQGKGGWEKMGPTFKARGEWKEKRRGEGLPPNH